MGLPCPAWCPPPAIASTKKPTPATRINKPKSGTQTLFRFREDRAQAFLAGVSRDDLLKAVSFRRLAEHCLHEGLPPPASVQRPAFAVRTHRPAQRALRDCSYRPCS